MTRSAVGVARRGGASGAAAMCFVFFAAGASAEPSRAGGGAGDSAGDPERGRSAFGVCRTCHDVGPGAKHKTGPDLTGVLGRPIGSVEGFAYSLPMVAAGLHGLYWDETLLDIYIWRSKSIVPMSEKWLVDVDDVLTRRDIIAYIKDQSARAAKSRK